MTTRSFYNEHLFKGNFGLERETLRVDQNGLLSKHKHPFVEDSNVERDFCENQIEVITPVCDSINSLYSSLDSIDRRVRGRLLTLGDGEYLWPFSNPPYVSEDSIQIADYHGSMKDKSIYRNYLSEKYGKHKMLFCGIHFNFSYSDIYVREAFEKSEYCEFVEFKNKLYLDLAKKVYSYSWLIVFLTAASPVFDSSFINDAEADRVVFNEEASLRNGINGYWNTFVPVLDYSDIESYVGSIDNYVKRGQMHSAAECYIPVRVKPKGENSLNNLMSAGINHIELRMLDLNPLARLGIFKDDLQFMQLFLQYLTCIPAEKLGEFDKNAQQNAVMNHKKAARFDCDVVFIDGIPLASAGAAVLDNMEKFFSQLGKKEEALLITSIKTRLLEPKRRYSQKIFDLFYESYLQKGLALAKYYSSKDAHDYNGEDINV